MEMYEIKLYKKLYSIVLANYRDPAFNVQRLSSEIAMSRYTLFRKMKRFFDKKSHEFIEDVWSVYI